MAGIPAEQAHDVREALRIIVSDPGHGAATLSNPQAMSNLLKDLLPDAPREKNLLVAAADARVAAIMLDHIAQGVDARSAVRLAAASFGDNTHFTDGVCAWIAKELAVALSLAPDLADDRTEMPDDRAEQRVAAAEPPAVAAEPPAAAAEPPVEAAEPQAMAAEIAQARPAPTRRATTLVSADDAAANARLSPGPSQGGATARGRSAAGMALSLAGLLAALGACLVPMYFDYSIGAGIVAGGPSNGLRAFVLIVLVAAALCAVQTVRSRAGRAARAAASAGTMACAILLGSAIWRVYAGYVRPNGYPIRAGLILGVISVPLLIAGGLAELRRRQATRRAQVGASGTGSTGPASAAGG